MTDGTWLDPWLKLRDKTAVRNEIATVADRYSKMQRLALAQLNDLRQKPKTRHETLEELERFIRFCGDKGQPLFEKLETIETEIYEETERLNNEQAS